MLKRLIGLSMMLCCLLCVSAQQLTLLPINPKVLTGKLPNGLTYYIMHNEKPEGRANFYIAQKVGSTLETPEQLGLAHFLEHMAFNGTTHFPGKEMLEYLQHKGIRFGEDINAYTGFDETVYRINNVPTSDEALMDSVLLVLHDWSCDLTLADEEIDAERGVIESEWRQRNDADTRMLTAVLPQIFEEYQYRQMPIGSMDVVRNFPYQVLRDYYHKWYRPDQQGIIVVGDFDAKAMEEKVKALFSPIQMPDNAAERTYPVVSDNAEPIIVTFEDPEIERPTVRLAFKSDKWPFESRNTLEYYLTNQIMTKLLTRMINERLSDEALKADCKYIYASVYFGNYWISSTKDSFNLFVIPKDNSREALEEALAIVTRACKTGLNAAEFERAKDSFLSSMESSYNEREKTNSHAYGQELTRLFVDNEPAPGIEAEWQLVQQMLGMLPLEAFNEVASQLVTKENQVLVVSQPQGAAMTLPSKEDLMSTMEKVETATYEPLVEEVISEPLLSKMPKKGKIKSVKPLPQFDATEIVLSNGVKVFVKTTDYAADMIMLSATAPFGKYSMQESEMPEAHMIEDAAETAKLGNFDNKTLRKALAGKQAAIGYSMNAYSSGFTGGSNTKDLETLMQLVYKSFTEMAPDAETYKASAAMSKGLMANQENTPDFVFISNYRKTAYGDNKFANEMTTADIDAADYDKMMKMLGENVANAADYQFVIVGNADIETLKPMLEQYVASLPANPKKLSIRKNVPVRLVNGMVKNEVEMKVESPVVKEIVVLHGDMPYNLENEMKLDMMAKILDMIYVRTLREELGGTYGASVQSTLDFRNNEWSLIYLYDTNADQSQQLQERAVADIDQLISEGATPEDFKKVKEAMLSQYEIQSKENRYWHSLLRAYALNNLDSTKAADVVKGITLEDLNAFMKTLNVKDNRIQLTLNAVAESK